MGIGYHVKKHMAAKAAEAAADAVEYVITDEEESMPEPVTTAPAADVTMAQALQMIAQLIASVKDSGSAEQKERVALEAERLLLERERLSRDMPESKQPPLISVFNAEGDRDAPKTAENGRGLRCQTLWCGYELKDENMTVDEIQWVNRLEPGDFHVLKADGTRIPFNVKAKVDGSSGKLEQVSIWFPCKGDQMHNHGSLTSYCQQALGARIPTAEELMLQLQQLQAELALAKAGVAGVV